MKADGLLNLVLIVAGLSTCKANVASPHDRNVIVMRCR